MERGHAADLMQRAISHAIAGLDQLLPKSHEHANGYCLTCRPLPSQRSHSLAGCHKIIAGGHVRGHVYVEARRDRISYMQIQKMQMCFRTCAENMDLTQHNNSYSTKRLRVKVEHAVNS